MLTDLYCEYNQLTTLDVSTCKELECLYCYCNQLTTLDVGTCALLRYLHCEINKLTALDVTACTGLLSLDCYENSLTTLDIGSCTGITDLGCGFNQLTTLDVSTFTELTWLECGSNQLTTLDVSACTMLEYLNCGFNQLSALDVSTCSRLASLICCHNKITTLDISNCPVLQDYANKEYASGYAPFYPDDSTITEFYDDDLNYFIFDSKVLLTPSPMITVLKSKKVSINAKTVWQIDLGDEVGKSFKSSKRKVATVDQNGLITAKSAGKTRITFKVGKRKRTLTLTVKDPTIPTTIKLNISGINVVKKGDTLVLTATINEGAVSGIKWTTNKKRVATVKNGVVEFKNPGKVTITATTVRGKKKAEVKFRVTK